MTKRFPSYPAVDAASVETRSRFGYVEGKKLTPADYEAAKNFKTGDNMTNEDRNTSVYDTTKLTFSTALQYIKMGKKVAREGWNGKGMFVFLVPGSTFKVNRPPLLGIYPEGTEIKYHAHIDMKTADGQIVPWLASQSDMLAEDYFVVHNCPLF